MNTSASFDLVMMFFMSIIGFSTLGLAILLGIFLVRQGKKGGQRSTRSYSSSPPEYSSYSNQYFNGSNPDEVLPNGWRRKDYYEYGLTDNDLEFWGLDLPGPPEPALSGIVLMDLADGDFNGEIDLW